MTPDLKDQIDDRLRDFSASTAGAFPPHVIAGWVDAEYQDTMNALRELSREDKARRDKNGHWRAVFA